VSTLSRPQHAALAKISAYNGTFTTYPHLLQSCGITGATVSSLRMRGYLTATEAAHGMPYDLTLTEEGRTAVAQANQRLLKRFARQPGTGLDQHTLKLLHHLEEADGVWEAWPTKHDYTARMRIIARSWLDQVETEYGWRFGLSDAGREALAHHRRDHAPQIDYAARGVLSQAINEECGSIPLFADRDAVQALLDAHLARPAHLPGHYAVTAAGYVHTGVDTDHDRIVRMAATEWADPATRERSADFFAISCPKGMDPVVFRRTVTLLAELDDAERKERERHLAELDAFHATRARILRSVDTREDTNA
jgi:hypothetical protein